MPPTITMVKIVLELNYYHLPLLATSHAISNRNGVDSKESNKTGISSLCKSNSEGAAIICEIVGWQGTSQRRRSK